MLITMRQRIKVLGKTVGMSTFTIWSTHQKNKPSIFVMPAKLQIIMLDIFTEISL